MSEALEDALRKATTDLDRAELSVVELCLAASEEDRDHWTLWDARADIGSASDGVRDYGRHLKEGTWPTSRR